MLHSEKARANHSADKARLNKSIRSANRHRDDHLGYASDMVRSGAPIEHVQHMINKGRLFNDL